MSDAHIGALLAAHAARWPDKPAIVQPDGVVCTFGALARRAAAISGALDAWGVPPGGHVLLLLPIGVPLYEALLGVMWGGRTVVLVDPSADKRRLDQALARVGLDAFLGTPKAHLLRLLLASTRGLSAYAAPRGLGPFARRIDADGAPGPRRDPPDGEPALITFTTGTTGVPKAIGRSHAFLLAQHDVLAHHMGLGPDDVDLPTLPVFLLNSLAAGATCVLPDGDLRDVSALDPDRLLAQIARHGVTTTSGSPAYLERLAARIAARAPERGLTKVFAGGARVRGDLLRRLAEAFPAARIEVVYGSTEAEPIAVIDAAEALAETVHREAEGACVGRPVPGIALRLIDPAHGGEVPAGQPGEVQVSGRHVNRGYYRDPDADAANKVRDGERVWHRTGDVAWADASGRLWLVGRVGEAVEGRWPFVVEARAEAVPGVARAALVAVDGVAVVAFVGEASEEAVREATAVDRAVRVDGLPVDPRHRAKIDRAALVRQLSATGAR